MDQLIAIVVLLGGAALLIGGLVVVGRRKQDDIDPLTRRLQEYGDRELPASLEELEMQLSFQDRVVVPLYEAIARFAIQFTPEQQIEHIRKKIDQAGMTHQTDPSVFLGQRIFLTIALGCGTFFLFFIVAGWPMARVVIGTGFGAFLGYQLPMLQLSSKISRRKAEVIRSLPDALDLMVICVEAGLGFDAAMGKVYEKWDNEIATAFGRIIQEIQLGKVRRDAMRDMSSRLDVPDFSNFASAIIQADQLGVSIGKILRIQSDQMRIKRRQRAQEKAHQAPVKMMIPMTFFIFPSIWIVLLGPSIITVMTLGIL
jgi:tight adherence protein C